MINGPFFLSTLCNLIAVRICHRKCQFSGGGLQDEDFCKVKEQKMSRGSFTSTQCLPNSAPIEAYGNFTSECNGPELGLFVSDNIWLLH